MKKVLVITYYWPPAGGPGVQRWLKFVKYLPDFAVAPIVYIPENPHYPLIDDSLMDEVPKDIKCYKQPIFEPYGLSSFLSGKKTKRISAGVITPKNQSLLERLMLWVRGNLFIPDARKFWVKPSVRFLGNILRDEGIDTVITTGPPHSLHLIGLKLKQVHNVQWVADFRDPWTSIGYHKKLKLSSVSQRQHKQLERKVLNTADKIIVTSKTTKHEFEQITSKPIKVITNGYDLPESTSASLDKKFTISHIGSMLTDRNPINLWKLLGELVRDNPDFKSSLELNFVGVVGENILNSIKEYGLEKHVNVIGYLPHEQAVEYQLKSQILLLVEIDSQETVGIIPGKFFEYLWAKRPILGIGPSGWEVADMITETKSGKVFDYTANSELKNVILNWFESYKGQSLTISSQYIEKYSRKELTRQLAEYI